MRKILTICLFEIGRIFKKPQSYIVMFAMPLLFTLLFGSLFGAGEKEPIVIAIVDQDQSSLSKAFVENIKRSESFRFKEYTNADAKRLVKEKQIPGFLLLEKGVEDAIFSDQKPPIAFTHGPEFTSSGVVLQVVSNSLSKMLIEEKGAKVWSQYSGERQQVMFEKLSMEEASSPSIERINVTRNKSTQTMDSMSERAAGFSIMFVMIVMLSSTGAIIEAKNTGVWSRLLTTPTSKVELMVGYVLAFFVIGWLQFAILMVASSLLFQVSWGSILGVFVLVSSLLLCVIGLGLLIASFSKTVEQQMALGNIIIASTCMLGGVYWPLDIVPKFMRTIADFVPQTWAMKGFTEIIARGGGIVDITTPIIILAAFGILFLLIGIKRVQYE